MTERRKQKMATGITQTQITDYVKKNLPDFHKARLESLRKLKLQKVLSRKNPYLFKTKGLATSRDLVKAVLDAHLSSQEETVLGGFLEGLAVFICSKVYGGGKSGANGIDLEFKKDGRKYFVSIKSGPNWGNSEQIKKLRMAFKEVRKIYGQDKNSLPVECVNGCCYGKQKTKSEHKGDYIKLCGSRFWALISGDESTYLKIVEPLGHEAKERNIAFLAKYELVVDEFTELFRAMFCDNENNILWEKLTEFSSGPPTAKQSKKSPKNHK
jgi:hypothetical protein